MVIKLVIDGFIALGTVAVAILAIWGDWFRSTLGATPSLTLIGHTLDGDPTPIAGSSEPSTFSSGSSASAGSIPNPIRPGSGTRRAMYYHLKVVNQRRWIPAQNCRVLLVGLSRRDPSGIFQPVVMSVPRQFVWAPSEFTPPVITLLREQVVDFGCIVENAPRFQPLIYTTPFNFQGFVGPNEAVRYQLQIEAVNFISPIYVVEVSWDGQWSYVPAEMKQHLPIRIVPPPTA
jgi:hypothetical protein